MAVHTITAKQVLSRVRQVFPDAGETYVINIINDALVEAGMYNTKVAYAKTDIIKDQMWYTLNDDYSGQKINKVYRLDIKDSSGDYIKIPRLLDGETQRMDLT
tara:strand:- start:3812 stop:4120 length:309 start_codon:yes stop_codon:yes gene_type:complete